MDNTNNFQQNKSLFEAFENEQVEIVKELLKQGADPNLQNEHGQTALQYMYVMKLKKFKFCFLMVQIQILLIVMVIPLCIMHL